MRRLRSAAALAALVCCMVAVDASGAQATEYANHAGINSGENFFGPSVTLFASETVGLGQALGCAGIRGISGVECEIASGEYVAVVLEYDVKAEPYIHNHATYRSFFDGWYYT